MVKHVLHSGCPHRREFHPSSQIFASMAFFGINCTQKQCEHGRHDSLQLLWSWYPSGQTGSVNLYWLLLHLVFSPGESNERFMEAKTRQLRTAWVEKEDVNTAPWP